VREPLADLYVANCRTKTASENVYPAKGEAKRAASRFRRTTGADEVSWYRCLSCGLYHLGTKRNPPGTRDFRHAVKALRRLHRALGRGDPRGEAGGLRRLAGEHAARLGRAELDRLAELEAELQREG
jgi:hypothetical protein